MMRHDINNDHIPRRCIIGIDPGSWRTGWAVIKSFVAEAEVLREPPRESSRASCAPKTPTLKTSYGLWNQPGAALCNHRAFGFAQSWVLDSYGVVTPPGSPPLENSLEQSDIPISGSVGQTISAQGYRDLMARKGADNSVKGQKSSGNSRHRVQSAPLNPDTSTTSHWIHPLAQRLHWIYNALEEIIQHHKPDTLVLESCFVRPGSPQTALVLAYARSIPLLLGAKHGLTILEIAPASVKKFLTGHGGASKQAMAAYIKDLFGLLLPHDGADATALALYGAHTPV